MAKCFQFESITEQIKRYVFAITLSIKKKNCSSMSREIGISKKQLYKAYANAENNAEQIKSVLTKIAIMHQKENLPSIIIVDPTQIRKWFAKNIDGLAYDYDGVIHKSKKCLSPVVAAWTNSKITIPLDFKFWINRYFTKTYKKKTELAQELLLDFKHSMHIDYALLDGAFSSIAMICFFKKHRINFCMRIARNRVIISKNGIKAQLQNHPKLRFKRNQCYKTIKATYKGIECFFTAHKRYSKNKKSCDIVYIVSSLNIPAKEQAKTYNIRWNIEKIFRTTKQSLGLADCQSTNLKKQRLHIFSVFLAYAKLEEQKVYKRKKSVEQIIKIMRVQKKPFNSFESYLQEQTIMN